jgi:2-polyprenyl-3-methyl-5-hydroxy-6-metoxy-1,4-benzoquinol methylase
MLIEFIPTFKYFSQFTDWNPNYEILDFGSNCGNLLKSGPLLDQSKYTGIDVDAHSIEEGKKLFPYANWISYNRFNPAYNSNGTDVLPSLENEFNLIVSYSVFTHMDFEDCEKTVEYLISKLKPGGKLLFSYCNIENRKCVEYFRRKRGTCDEIPVTDFLYLIENKTSVITTTDRCRHFVAFYKPAWLQEKLKRFNVSLLAAPRGWIQDCVQIHK